MTSLSHLWAVVFDDVDGAGRVRAALDSLQDSQFLIVEDMVVVVRAPDGSFRLDREPFPFVGNVAGCSAAGFLAGLVLLAPFTGAAVGALLGATGSATAAAHAGIEAGFIREVQGLMRPGTSAVFLLGNATDMGVVAHRIRGLGGTVVKTNVDPGRVKQIQAALSSPPCGEPK
jgi:uncharacterized membrane protein